LYAENNNYVTFDKLLFSFVSVDDSDIEFDMEQKKIFVTSDKSQEELTVALKKTGKSVEYVGVI